MRLWWNWQKGRLIIIIENNNFILSDPLRQREQTKKISGFIDSNGCFICTTYAPNKRYYKITRVVDGKKREFAMHRYIYETYIGKIGEGLVIRHTCDNSLCINPYHLETGTQAENMKDMASRGRSLKGKRNFNFKLSDADILEIKRMLNSKEYRQSEIARMYNVSDPMITYIKKGLR